MQETQPGQWALMCVRKSMSKNRLSVDGSLVLGVASRQALPGNSLAVQFTDARHFLGMDSEVCPNQPSGAILGQSLRTKAIGKRETQQAESLEGEHSWRLGTKGVNLYGEMARRHSKKLGIVPGK